MKSLLATCLLVDLVLPVGRTFLHHSVVLVKDGVDGDPVTTTEDTITFEDLEAGSYVAVGSSIADDGSVLSGPFSSDPFVIAPDAPASAKVLSSITLALAPEPPAGP